MSRRFPSGLFALALAFSATGAHGQTYPAKPIRLIVASAPGGGIDVLARLMAPEFGEHIGQLAACENSKRDPDVEAGGRARED